MACRTRGARLRRAINAASEWCRRHRHLPVKEQHRALVRKLVGHYNYFGVNGNLRALRCLLWAVRRAWRKWLNRRSQRARMNWQRFEHAAKLFFGELRFHLGGAYRQQFFGAIAEVAQSALIAGEASEKTA